MATSTHIAIITFSVLFVVAVTLPFIQEEFGETQTDIDTDNFQDEIGEQVTNPTASNLIGIGVSLFKMWFWYYPELNWFINALFVILKIAFIIALVDMLWIG
jgi:hypothetical protein